MEEKITLGLGDLLHILWKGKWIIIGISLIFASITAFVNLALIKPTYEANVSIVVGQEKDNGKDIMQYNSDSVVMYQKLLKTYASIAESETVVKKTLKDLNISYNYDEYLKYKSSISVIPKADTQILELIVKDGDPKKAVDIANTLTNNFINQAKLTLPVANMKLLDTATLPEKPVKPNKILNTIIAGFIGLLLSSTILILNGVKYQKIKSEDDVEKYLELAVVGMIPKRKNKN